MNIDLTDKKRGLLPGFGLGHGPTTALIGLQPLTGRHVPLSSPLPDSSPLGLISGHRQRLPANIAASDA